MRIYRGCEQQIVAIRSFFFFFFLGERVTTSHRLIYLRSFVHIDVNGNAVGRNSLWSHLMRLEFPAGLYHGYPVMDGISSNQ